MTIFRSAVTGADGTIDSGYLSLFGLMAVVITAIPFMCIFAAIAMVLDPAHRFDVQALGIGIGSVCTGFGVSVGAVGAFRMGDKERPGTVTTTQNRTTVETSGESRGTPAKPLHVAIEGANE